MGCSFDAPGDNKAFKDKFNFPFDLLSDTDKSMSIAYGAANEDSSRPIRISVLIGPDGKVVNAYEIDDAEGHAARALRDLG